jgi:hypothetical protein
MRRTDSSIAAIALWVRATAPLEAEQRRDRLQVVLDPMVDLADRRVLRHQQPIANAQVGDVAQQQRRRRSIHSDDRRQSAIRRGVRNGSTRTAGDDTPIDHRPPRRRPVGEGPAQNRQLTSRPADVPSERASG